MGCQHGRADGPTDTFLDGHAAALRAQGHTHLGAVSHLVERARCRGVRLAVTGPA
jgi:hypothetical protein